MQERCVHDSWLCLDAATNIEGSVAWEIVHPRSATGVAITKMEDPSEIVEVPAEFGPGSVLRSVGTVWTERWLMKGVVFR